MQGTARNIALTAALHGASKQKRRNIEAIFGELKNQIELRRVRFRTLTHVPSQLLMAGAAPAPEASCDNSPGPTKITQTSGCRSAEMHTRNRPPSSSNPQQPRKTVDPTSSSETCNSSARPDGTENHALSAWRIHLKQYSMQRWSILCQLNTLLQHLMASTLTLSAADDSPSLVQLRLG
jgi:hypothetical protein